VLQSTFVRSTTVRARIARRVPTSGPCATSHANPVSSCCTGPWRPSWRLTSAAARAAAVLVRAPPAVAPEGPRSRTARETPPPSLLAVRTMSTARAPPRVGLVAPPQHQRPDPRKARRVERRLHRLGGLRGADEPMRAQLARADSLAVGEREQPLLDQSLDSRYASYCAWGTSSWSAPPSWSSNSRSLPSSIIVAAPKSLNASSHRPATPSRGAASDALDESAAAACGMRGSRWCERCQRALFAVSPTWHEPAVAVGLGCSCSRP